MISRARGTAVRWMRTPMVPMLRKDDDQRSEIETRSENSLEMRLSSRELATGFSGVRTRCIADYRTPEQRRPVSKGSVVPHDSFWTYTKRSTRRRQRARDDEPCAASERTGRWCTERHGEPVRRLLEKRRDVISQRRLAGKRSGSPRSTSADLATFLAAGKTLVDNMIDG